MAGLLARQFLKDEFGVWVPTEGKQQFGYSDGLWVEEYLERAMRSVSDLSSESAELESYIREWNTEYHLTRKRKDLLSGLDHNRTAKVLEIGCGCGAITRFLGETYDNVVAVEGSYNRAKLARLRTSDLPNVEVYASPYQHIGLEGQFDVVFCIGVLEYAPTYVDAEDPFAHALESMKRMLKPNGSLVIAIENKFGLKYFANSTEDHAGRFFEGIEGYPREAHGFETFGRLELQKILGRYWDKSTFYYPFPDYKLPTSLLSDECFAAIDAGELIAGTKERDYARDRTPFFDTRLVWPEVTKNGLAPHLSNSFLVVAGTGSEMEPTMGDRLAVLFNRERKPAFSTRSDVVRSADGIVVQKAVTGTRLMGAECVSISPEATRWVNAPTLAYTLFRRAHHRHFSQADLGAILQPWWDWLQAQEIEGAAAGHVPGYLIDALWHNVSLMPDGKLSVFDQELVWFEDLPMKDVFLRSAIQWVARYAKREMPLLGTTCAINAVRLMAASLGLSISHADVRRVLRREAKLQATLGTASARSVYAQTALTLYVPFFPLLKRGLANLEYYRRRARNLSRRLLGR